MGFFSGYDDDELDTVAETDRPLEVERYKFEGITYEVGDICIYQREIHKIVGIQPEGYGIKLASVEKPKADRKCILDLSEITVMNEMMKILYGD